VEPGPPTPPRPAGEDPGDLAGRTLSGLANATLALYGADGLVSLADVSLRAAVGSDALAGVRDFFAQLALVAVLFLWSALGASPRLPKRILLPLVLGTGWWAIGAPPLRPPLGPAGPLDAAGVAVQLALLAATFLAVRRRTGAWWLEPAHLPGVTARLASTLGFVAVHAALLPPVLGASLVLGAAAGIERATAGFVTFHAREIRIHDRTYTRDGDEVRLVGMMHVGEREAYESLFRSFDVPGTIVLLEGVSDDRDLLQADLSYAPVAEALGLAEQPGVGEALGRDPAGEHDPSAGAELRRADVDVADFQPDTLRFLEAASGLWSAPDLRAGIEAVQAFSRRPDADRLVAAARADVLELRNRHLLRELDAALARADRVVIPWGALHLAEVEATLRARGFVLQSASERPLVRYATLAAALRRAAEPASAAESPAAPGTPGAPPPGDTGSASPPRAPRE